MKLKNHLVIACVCASAAWMPVANAQLHGRQETRSGVPESNWLPTAPGKPFSLTWRTYMPKEIVKQGNWFPPAVAKRD